MQRVSVVIGKKNGKTVKAYFGFKSLELVENITQLVNTATLVYSVLKRSDEMRYFDIQDGDDAVVYFDNKVMLTGYVYRIDHQIDSGTNDYTVLITSKSKDLVDSIIDMSLVKSYNARTVTLRSLLTRILNIHSPAMQLEFDLSTRGIENTPFTSQGVTSDDQVAIVAGQSVADTMQNLCLKYKVFIKNQKDGSLLITRGTSKKSKYSLINIKGDKYSNIKESNCFFDDENVFFSYIVQADAMASQTFNDEGGVIKSGNGVSVTSKQINPEVRNTRQFNMITTNGESENQLTEILRWKMNSMMYSSFQYNCTVYGWNVNPYDKKSPFWEANQVIDLKDDSVNGGIFARTLKGDFGIDDTLRCIECRFNYSATNGTTATMQLTNADVFLLTASEPLVTAITRRRKMRFDSQLIKSYTGL